MHEDMFINSSNHPTSNILGSFYGSLKNIPLRIEYGNPLKSSFKQKKPTHALSKNGTA